MRCFIQMTLLTLISLSMAKKKLKRILVLILIDLVVLANFISPTNNIEKFSNLSVAFAQGGSYHVYLPLVFKSPFTTSSYYMNHSEVDFNPPELGQADAVNYLQAIQSGDRIITILAWGQPCKYSDTEWGAYEYTETCHRISNIQIDIQNYISGFCAQLQNIRPGGSGQYCGYNYNTQQVPVIIGLGVDNCIGGINCANPPGSPSNAVTYEHGQAWGTIVQSINSYVISHGYGYQIFVVGAMDIEAPWNTYTNTKTWLDGYKDTCWRNFYNYGTCDCPDGYQPYAPFARDWSYDRIHEVSQRGLPVKYPLPEIYHTDGIDARRWQGLSLWGYLNGYSKITFQELLTQSRACSQTQNCNLYNTLNTPIMAIQQMREALDSDWRTADGLVPYSRSTDMTWYPRP